MAEEQAQQAQEEEIIHLEGEGETVPVTKDQLKQLAQKAKFVLPKIQSEKDKLEKKVEEVEKQSKAAVELMQDLNTILSGDENEAAEALERFGSAVGLSEDEIRYVLEGDEPASEESFWEDDEDEEEEESTPKKRSTGKREPLHIDKSHLSPDLRNLIDQFEQQQLNQLRDLIFTQLDKHMEADVDLGKLKKGNAAAFGVLRDFARQALQRRAVVEGAAPGPLLYDEVVNEVKKFAKGLGIRFDEAKDLKEELTAVGLGPLADTLGDEFHREQPPERVPLDSPDYAKSFRARIAQKLLGKVRKG